nr:hypothetical protein 1634Bnrm2_p060 [Cryptomonas sp.]
MNKKNITKKKSLYTWNKIFFIFFVSAVNFLITFGDENISNKVFVLFSNCYLMTRYNNYNENAYILLTSSAENAYGIIRNINSKSRILDFCHNNLSFFDKTSICSSDFFVAFKSPKTFVYLKKLLKIKLKLKILFEYKIYDINFFNQINNMIKIHYIAIFEKNFFKSLYKHNLCIRNSLWTFQEYYQKKNKKNIFLNLINFKFKYNFSKFFSIFITKKTKKFIIVIPAINMFMTIKNYLDEMGIKSVLLYNQFPKDLVLKNIKIFNSKLVNCIVLTKEIFFSNVILSKIDLREIPFVFFFKPYLLDYLNIGFGRKFSIYKKYAIEMIQYTSLK